MFRIAAECSLMLNGRGFSYERNNVDIVLTEKEAEAVANSVELDLCGYLKPESEALLSSALGKFNGAPRTAIQTITCHGRDDYALWKWRSRPICSTPSSGRQRKRWGHWKN